MNHDAVTVVGLRIRSGNRSHDDGTFLYRLQLHLLLSSVRYHLDYHGEKISVMQCCICEFYFLNYNDVSVIVMS